MKKSNLIKLFSILLIATIAMVMMFNTAVLAAEDDDEGDEDEIELSLDNTNTNTNNTNTNTNNTNTNTNNTNKANNTNNASIYNNTNLPKTGVAQSIPVVALILVFGVSAVYAYKKIKDYRNV